MTSDNTTIPCVDCVCVPICRHKEYPDLYWDCKLLEKHIKEILPSDGWDYDNPTVFESLKQVLKPTGWSTTPSGNIKHPLTKEKK